MSATWQTPAARIATSVGSTRPSAADDRDGVGVGDAAESGRSPQGRFGEPEP